MHFLASIDRQNSRYKTPDPGLTRAKTTSIMQIMQFNGSRQPARQASADRPRALLRSMTCVADGREHWIADSVSGARRSGRYPALCGRQVMAAALAAPQGPACPACAVVLAEGYRRRRSRRTDVLVQMIGLAARSHGKHRRVGAR